MIRLARHRQSKCRAAQAAKLLACSLACPQRQSSRAVKKFLDSQMYTMEAESIPLKNVALIFVGGAYKQSELRLSHLQAFD